MSAGMSLLTGNTAGAMSSLFGAAKGAFDMNQSHEKTKKTKTSPADVIMWSGCKDDQTVRVDSVSPLPLYSHPTYPTSPNLAGHDLQRRGPVHLQCTSTAINRMSL